MSDKFIIGIAFLHSLPWVIIGIGSGYLCGPYYNPIAMVFGAMIGVVVGLCSLNLCLVVERRGLNT